MLSSRLPPLFYGFLRFLSKLPDPTQEPSSHSTLQLFITTPSETPFFSPLISRKFERPAFHRKRGLVYSRHVYGSILAVLSRPGHYSALACCRGERHTARMNSVHALRGWYSLPCPHKAPTMIENAVTWLAVISPAGSTPEVFLFEEATQATPHAI